MCLKFKQLEEDEIFKASMGIRFVKDNMFEEIRNQELMMKRLEFVSAMQALQDETGKPFFSTQYLVEKYMKIDQHELDANAAAKKKTQELGGSEEGEGGGGGGEGEGGGGLGL
jgi:hypothetical protein